MTIQMTEAETQKMVILRSKFPGSPEAELLRFCRARPKNIEDAAKFYEDYICWRKTQGAPENLTKYVGSVPMKWVRRCGFARDGTPASYCQGGRFDPSIEPEKYILFCAHLIDQMVKADDITRITVLIDVRGGEGWPNASPHKMVGFFRLANQILNANYPERAHRLIIYPVPSMLTHLWTMFSSMLDSVTKEKFVIICGDASIGAKCPPELFEYITTDQFPLDAQALHQPPCPADSSKPLKIQGFGQKLRTAFQPSTPRIQASTPRLQASTPRVTTCV